MAKGLLIAGRHVEVPDQLKDGEHQFLQLDDKGNLMVLLHGRDGAVPVPVKVDDQGRLVLAGQISLDPGDINIGGVVVKDSNDDELFTDDNPGKVTLTGQLPQPEEALPVSQKSRVEPSLTELMTETPLAASGQYTSPEIDCQEYTWANGGKGVVSVSALARANAQGTLYLEGRNDPSQSWVRVATAAVNNTGTGRLRRTNVFTRYVRLRFVNGEDAQTSFSLHRTLWQVTDGQGDTWGEGADWFYHRGPIAPLTTVLVCDLRSAAELQGLSYATDRVSGINLQVHAYKDSGAMVPLIHGITPTTESSNFSPYRYENGYIYDLFERDPVVHDPDNDRWAYRLSKSVVCAKGFRVTVRNTSDTEVNNVGVSVRCRIL